MLYANLAQMHRAVAERLGPRTALRFKQDGMYHDLCWNEYRTQADLAAAGLIALGLNVGDRLALLAENRYEWLIADIAALTAGLADVTMHSPLAPKQVLYQVDHSQARGVIVSGQAQADKVYAVLKELPGLEFLVSFDEIQPKGKLRHLTWNALLALGWRQGQAGQQEIDRREQMLNHESLATVIYTSGTTGNPKGVMLTHGNLLTNAEAMQQVAQVGPTDTLLSWLPYSHIYARTVDHYHTILAELVVALAENVDTLARNLLETQPTWLTAVPRFYEKVWSYFEHLPLPERQTRLPAMFGSRIRWLSSGGAPLPKHIGFGFKDSGLEIYEGYGLTETSPVISFNRLGNNKVGTVGQAIPGVEVKIAPDGEILTKGPHVMKGYWREPDATAQVLEPDGWFHTGDIGTLDAEGFLTITDRKKDIIVTSLGKNVTPSEIERLLTSDPYIDQAVTYGDARPFITALIVPNFPLLEKKAKELNCTVDIMGDFLRSPHLHAFFKERIDALMSEVSNPERVKEFLILSRPLRLEDEELTATLKVRRRAIVQKYRAELDALYAKD
jgi:long-chain acyl-CoA synthetase